MSADDCLQDCNYQWNYIDGGRWAWWVDNRCCGGDDGEREVMTNVRSRGRDSQLNLLEIRLTSPSISCCLLGSLQVLLFLLLRVGVWVQSSCLRTMRRQVGESQMSTVVFLQPSSRTRLTDPRGLEMSSVRVGPECWCNVHQRHSALSWETN